MGVSKKKGYLLGEAIIGTIVFWGLSLVETTTCRLAKIQHSIASESWEAGGDCFIGFRVYGLELGASNPEHPALGGPGTSGSPVTSMIRD